ncbi:Hypothetical predicted protein [Scomber scombrus]|uniref:Uncharacterized protein n=1 Tax=Scomber scombrus TaxID=13677 RepID=A0AAV1Q478_SCOSC
MRTESHGGDGGLLEDREDGEDGEDDRPKASIRRTDTDTLSASVPAAVRAVRGSVRLHPRSSSTVRCPVTDTRRYLKCGLSVRAAAGFKRRTGCWGDVTAS